MAVGDDVTPGEAMMMLVPDRLWVTANFKETQIDRMQPGQPATISIDACGGRRVSGHVVSIQHGAGQAFQVLPPRRHRQLRQGGAARAGSHCPGRSPEALRPRTRHERRAGRESRLMPRGGGSDWTDADSVAGGRNPWSVVAVISIATFMEVLDASIVNVALDHVAGDLSMSYQEATWVATSYLVANAVVIPMSGWLSDTFGRKRYYMLFRGGIRGGIVRLWCIE